MVAIDPNLTSTVKEASQKIRRARVITYPLITAGIRTIFAIRSPSPIGGDIDTPGLATDFQPLVILLLRIGGRRQTIILRLEPLGVQESFGRESIQLLVAGHCTFLSG
jgi:hypothetical protein